MISKKQDRALAARKAMDFLQTSKMIDLKMPIEKIVEAVSELDQVAGYVCAWERYVIVVASAEYEERVSEEVMKTL